MEDHQILLAGEEASALLGQPLFVQALKARMNGHLEEILRSHDDDTKARESHFAKLRVYEAVLTDLEALVTRAETLRAEQLAAENTDQDDDEDPTF